MEAYIIPHVSIIFWRLLVCVTHGRNRMIQFPPQLTRVLATVCCSEVFDKFKELKRYIERGQTLRDQWLEDTAARGPYIQGQGWVKWHWGHRCVGRTSGQHLENGARCDCYGLQGVGRQVQLGVACWEWHWHCQWHSAGNQAASAAGFLLIILLEVLTDKCRFHLVDTKVWERQQQSWERIFVDYPLRRSR
jgi:hypothetical protein